MNIPGEFPFANQVLNLIIKTYDGLDRETDQQDLDQRTDELNGLESLWNVARVRVASHISQQRELRNSRSSFYQLPPEILASILKITSENSTRFKEAFWRTETPAYYRALAELMLVSKYCYTIISSTPSFWTHCEADYPPHLVFQILERSKGRALDIHLSTVDLHSLDQGQLRRVRYGTEFVPAFAEAIAPHHGRWRDINFTFHYSTANSYLPLLESPLPKLRHLNCLIPLSRQASPLLALNLEGSQGVGKIALHGILPTWSFGQLRGLEILSLVEVRAVPDGNGMSLNLLFDALRHSPKIKELNLDQVDFVNDLPDGDMPPIILPLHTVTLELSSSEIIGSIVHRIGELPSCTSLHIRHLDKLAGASDPLVKAIWCIVPALEQVDSSGGPERTCSMFLHYDGRVHFGFQWGVSDGRGGMCYDHPSNRRFSFQTSSDFELNLSSMGWFAEFLRSIANIGSMTLHVDSSLDWSTHSVRQFFRGLNVTKIRGPMRSQLRGPDPPALKTMLKYLGGETLPGGEKLSSLPELEELDLDDLEDATESDVLSMLRERYAGGCNCIPKILKLKLDLDPIDLTIVQEMRDILGVTNVCYPSWVPTAVSDVSTDDEHEEIVLTVDMDIGQLLDGSSESEVISE